MSDKSVSLNLKTERADLVWTFVKECAKLSCDLHCYICAYLLRILWCRTSSSQFYRHLLHFHMQTRGWVVWKVDRIMNLDKILFYIVFSCLPSCFMHENTTLSTTLMKSVVVICAAWTVLRMVPKVKPRNREYEKSKEKVSATSKLFWSWVMGIALRLHWIEVASSLTQNETKHYHLRKHLVVSIIKLLYGRLAWRAVGFSGSPLPCLLLSSHSNGFVLFYSRWQI